MGEPELRLVHLESAEEQQVDVQGARAETRCPPSACSQLESLCQPQELPGIQPRFGQQCRVEIRGLGQGGDRVGAVDGRDVQNDKMYSQPFDRGSKSSLGVTEISAKGQRYPGRWNLRRQGTPGRELAR